LARYFATGIIGAIFRAPCRSKFPRIAFSLRIRPSCTGSARRRRDLHDASFIRNVKRIDA
jgi:hypothetical protein